MNESNAKINNWREGERKNIKVDGERSEIRKILPGIKESCTVDTSAEVGHYIFENEEMTRKSLLLCNRRWDLKKVFFHRKSGDIIFNLETFLETNNFLSKQLLTVQPVSLHPNKWPL